MAQAAPRFEHFPHDADVGVRGYGRTPAEAFEQAALGLASATADVAAIAPAEAVDIECEAPDAELLLVDWLNAVIYEMATRRMCFSRFGVDIDGGKLRGRAWGEPADAERHRVIVEPKGCTYTALRVAQTAAGEWLAQCVVDV